MRRLMMMIAIAACSLVPAASHAASSDSASHPTPAIYDTLADTRAQIADGLKLAQETGRNVLIQWGANWCVWCRVLHRMLVTDSLVHALLESNYVWVLADVGVKGKNADLLEHYGIDRKQGIPFLTVLDTTGAVIANQETGALETDDKEHPAHDRARVLAFLQSHAPQ